jgi:hypothetical protein
MNDELESMGKFKWWIRLVGYVVHVRHEKCTHNFHWKTWREEANFENWMYVLWYILRHGQYLVYTTSMLG